MGQRIHGQALGYEDLNDHDALRHDPILRLISDTLTPKRANVATLAGKSTLNRLETAPEAGNARYHKIGVDEPALAAGVCRHLHCRAQARRPNASSSTWTPPTIPCTGLRRAASSTATIAATATCRSISSMADICWWPSCGAPTSMPRLVPRRNWRASTSPTSARLGRMWRFGCARICGFARDELMAWCEENRVDYVFGMARNTRLEAMIVDQLAAAKAEFEKTGKAVRASSRSSPTAPKMSWSRERRVVAKAEHLQKGANPRFIVTSLAACDIAGQVLYETIYCQRGEMENRIKECQLDLYADRTSAATLRANQLRLWFASLAYVLIEAVRRLALQGTQLAKATAGSIWLEASQARRHRHGQRAPHQDRHRLGLPRQGGARARPFAGCEASCWPSAPSTPTRPETARLPRTTTTRRKQPRA